MTGVKPRILLINPPIYDFAAHDFWLKPLGLLEVAGFLRGQAEMALFDFMDREHVAAPRGGGGRPDPWGRGKYVGTEVVKPRALAGIPRHYQRFGLPALCLGEFLAGHGAVDAVLVQTGMTYWYPGVQEVIAVIRAWNPRAPIVLGGPYASLCTDHAAGLGADLVIQGSECEPLWSLLGVTPHLGAPAFWEGYGNLRAGVVRLSDGCPCRCSYCAVPRLYGDFSTRPVDRCVAEVGLMVARGASDVAFYDDALLHSPELALLPFLSAVRSAYPGLRFHTPNAVHARLVTREVAAAMVESGVETFFLGLESREESWHRATGGKLGRGEFESAVRLLKAAGVALSRVTAYVVMGHPDGAVQDLEGTLRFAHDQGIRSMLAEYAPVPGTPDGERCRSLVDMDEPLNHNKTAFTVRALGWDRVQEVKSLCATLNRTIR